MQGNYLVLGRSQPSPFEVMFPSHGMRNPAIARFRMEFAQPTV